MAALGRNDDGSVRDSSERTVSEVASTPVYPSPSLSSAHHFVSIKLTAHNYLFWRTQMLPFLEGQGVLGFVDGSVECPVAASPESSTADSGSTASAVASPVVQWRRQDKAVLSLLISSLSDEMLPLAVGQPTSCKLWLAIEQELGSAMRSRAVRLLSELQRLSQGASSVSDYLNRARILVEDLALAGRPVPLDEQNIYVFRGLRSDLRPLVAPLTRGDPVTLSDLSDYLISQEYICAGDGPVGAPAALTVHRGGRGGRGRGRFSRGGSGSGGSGGSGSGSGGRGRGGRGRGRGRSDVRCQICDKIGHSTVNCWRRYSESSGPQANVAPSGGEGGSVDSHQWFPDTGATNHATPDSS
ncbi:PREDICTED: chromatin target of PRMT1 protein-like [Ipomoea nil]|uniref:chromatin target of PRMT1 protein-like n=1 Tax=Ipomoea nil TaxID=35883 RepID=UPI00090095F5|nr:PREDICTED: chromatin target of PRMT1 protein-like [Ipomoea nil]